MTIDRTLFWFRDGNDQIISLSEDFFGLSNLLNRLLNEKYAGRRIKFINIYFCTPRTYELYPTPPEEIINFHGGHLTYYGKFEKEEFTKLSTLAQYQFVWEQACKYLSESASKMKNDKLLSAIKYAYERGYEIHFDTSFEVLKQDVFINGELIKASIWILFGDKEMTSKLTLQRNGKLVYEEQLARTNNGVEVFLELYKTISVEGNHIVIQGRKDVEGLPVFIPISEIKKM